jgi:hypothetical protein
MPPSIAENTSPALDIEEPGMGDMVGEDILRSASGGLPREALSLSSHNKENLKSFVKDP